MTTVKRDEILGYVFNDGVTICAECATDEDLKDLTEDEILTDRDLDEYELKMSLGEVCLTLPAKTSKKHHFLFC